MKFPTVRWISFALGIPILLLGIPVLLLVVYVLCFFVSIKQENDETAMELNPVRRIAHDQQVVREHPADAAGHQQLGNSYSIVLFSRHFASRNRPARSSARRVEIGSRKRCSRMPGAYRTRALCART